MWADVKGFVPRVAGVGDRLAVRLSPQDIRVGGVRAGQDRFVFGPTTRSGYVFPTAKYSNARTTS